jgi:phosphatidylinositol 4-kinase
LTLCNNTQSLIQNTVLDQITASIQTCLKDHDVSGYGRQVLMRYWEDGIPLSSNRVVYDLLIVLRNVTARVLTNTHPSSSSSPSPSPSPSSRQSHWTDSIDAPWSLLMKKPFAIAEKNQELAQSLRSVYVMSSGYYEDIHTFAESKSQDGNKWSPDAYMQEIKGISLVSLIGIVVYGVCN